MRFICTGSLEIERTGIAGWLAGCFGLLTESARFTVLVPFTLFRVSLSVTLLLLVLCGLVRPLLRMRMSLILSIANRLRAFLF